MTYEQLVEKMRDRFEGADARAIYEHCAIQINITGEGEGTFYIEIANREICVEPYDYYDKDALMTVSSDVLVDLMEGRINSRQAYADGLIEIQGSMRKTLLFEKIVFKEKDKICLGGELKEDVK